MSFASSKPARERSSRAWLCSSISFCCALLLAGTVREAKAGFVGEYAFSNFTLTNSEFANGYASSLDPATLVLTGPNDGSGLPGTTDLTIAAGGSGIWRFDYAYSTLDDYPGFDFAGYILSTDFYQFADSTGQSSTIVVPVLLGENIGFRVGTLDNTGEPGVLTITNFTAPEAATTAPEPGSLQLILIAAAASIIVWNLRRPRFLPRVRPGILVVGGAAICLTVPMLAQSQFYYNPANVTGQLALTRVVNVSQQALASDMLQPVGVEKRPKTPPPRLHPPIIAGPFTLGADAVAPVLSIVPPSGISGFNALSHRDQRLAYSGNQFSVEPPSPSIAVGNGYVLEGVNDAIQIYNTSGTPSLPTVVATNQLFGLAPAIDWITGVNGVYLTDIRVYFDLGINRWFVVQRSQDNDIYGAPLNASHLYIAVSKTADPTADYNIYVMDTTNGSHPGCPCIADYPQIGADQYGFHIAWNEFTASSQGFVDAAILTLSKASLASGVSAPPAFQFLLPYTTHFEFSLQPAITPPGASNFLASGGLEYFVSSSGDGYGSQVSLWAMYNTSSLATPSPNVVLTRTTVPTLRYSYPDVATQRPGPLPYGSSLTPPGVLAYLDGGDPRVQSLSYASGRLYLTLQTGAYDQNGHWVAGGAYIVLSPTFRSGVLAGSVLNQGYLIVNSDHLLRPAIAVNAQGRGAIAVTLVGSDWYPSAAFIPFDTFSTPSTLQVAAPGALPEDGFTGYPDGGGVGVARWGDYNSAVGASDGAIWMVVQYIGDYPRTEYANWNTYVMRKQP